MMQTKINTSYTFLKLSLIALVLLICHESKAHWNLSAIRDVQIRSNKVVTLWLGYNSTKDSTILYDESRYEIGSPSDTNYLTPVNPINISRFSKGSRSANGPQDWRALTDELMHLEVKHPFKKGHLYFIKLKPGIIGPDNPQTVQFSMHLTPNPSFKVNQVGYSNKAVKLIYLSSYLGDGKPVDLSGYQSFNIVNATTKKIAYTGEVKFVSKKDPQGNDELYVLDFSTLKSDGYYYAEIDGLGRSYDFQLGNEAPKKIIETVARGFYFQRCGAELVQPYAGKWIRGMSHNKVWIPKKNIVNPWEMKLESGEYIDPTKESAGDWYVPEGPREIHGGHHDAGDFDTRLTHLVLPEKLMSLYETFPNRFTDGQFFIPERDNGLPDLLDEVAWSLMHYETLQDYFGEVRGEYGAVPPGMETYTHPPRFPVSGEGELMPYFMRKATPYTSFCGAAVFAQAARIFAPFNPEKAAKFLERAKAAYRYAVKHKDEKLNPENPKAMHFNWEEDYDDGHLATAWCWAAAQLFETTGKTSYMKAFTQRYKHTTRTFDLHKWTALWAVVKSNRTNVNKTVQQELREELKDTTNYQVNWVHENGKTGYMAACPNDGDWGKASPLMNIEILFRAYMLTKENKYLVPIATAVDFTLGMNPSEYSWMTHGGTVYPMDPLNANCKYDLTEEPYPGIVIFGPTSYWNRSQNPLYPNPENMGFYRRLSDVWGFVRGCEYVVNEQLANMYVAAGLLLEE